MLVDVSKAKYHIRSFHGGRSRLLCVFWNKSTIICTHVKSIFLKVIHHALPFALVHFTLKWWTHFDARTYFITLVIAFYLSNNHEFSKTRF